MPVHLVFVEHGGTPIIAMQNLLCKFCMVRMIQACDESTPHPFFVAAAWS